MVLRVAALACALAAASAQAPVYNVHISPHSHNDVGWGETYLEYYYGTGPYPAAVRNVTRILSQVVAGLLADPARRFSYVEMAFFALFWESAAPALRADMRALVAEGRLQFLNGAFSMHDEAAPIWTDMVDNTAVGHRFIADTFGESALPNTTWSIDPFGHSNFQGVLSSALAGYQGVLWGREPAEFKAASAAARALERVWLPSRSQEIATFAGVFWDAGYDSPKWVRCGPFLPSAADCARARGVLDAAQAAAEIAGARAAVIRGRDILINVGGDFNWMYAIPDAANASAGALFEYVDGIIAGLNADPARRFNAFYSTPSAYVSAKLAAAPVLPALVSDLFPYNDDAAGHHVWAGFFTSRPALKGFVRESSAIQAGARQLQAAAGGVAGTGPTNGLFALERALGVAQHHDAIAGTSRQDPADDYAARLAAGRAGAWATVGAALAALTGYTGEPFAPCELANASVCAPTEAGDAAVAVVHNSAGQPAAAAPLRVPVGFPAGVASWAVFDADGAAVAAQLVPPSPRDAALRALYGGSATPVQWLCFTAALPAAGFAAFFLVPVNASGAAPRTAASAVAPVPAGGPDARLTNGRLTLTVSAATGWLAAYADAATGLALPLAQSWAAYEGFNGSAPLHGDATASGAYIFRPARAAPDALAPGPARVELVLGPVVNLTRHTLGYVDQETRLWAGAAAAEVEWTVGPVDVAGNVSREVVTRYAAAGVASAGAFTTDANCREGQRRLRGARGNWTSNVSEPVAGNYYPVSCLIQTSGGGATLAVAVDRAQGGTSPADGALELMVHRRMRHRDGREPMQYTLDEPGVDGAGLIVRGRHWLLASPAAAAPAAAKAAQQAAMAAPTAVTAFARLDLAPDRWAAAYVGRASLLAAPLPANVALATLHARNDTAWLVRLAHLYEAGEDAALSANASVALATLFTRRATAATEMTLPGGRPLADVADTTYRTEGGLTTTQPARPPAPAGSGLVVSLAPMQIRTFLLAMEPLP